MKTNFILTHPLNEESSISLQIRDGSKRKKISIGIKVQSKNWNSKKQRVTNKQDNYVYINTLLNNLQDKIELEILKNKKDNPFVSFEHIANLVGKKVTLKKNDDDNLLYLMQKEIIKKTSPVYGLVFKKLKKFVGSDYLDYRKVDYGFIDDFTYYISQTLRKTTCFSYINGLLCVLRILEKKGYNINRSCFNVRIRQKTPFKIYLSLEEIEQIETYRHSNPIYEYVRDCFILSCYTGARISDISKMRASNIQGDYLVFMQQKTKTQVVVPLHPKVEHILKNRASYYKIFPHHNKIVKLICKEVGINQIVEIEDNGKIKKVKKYNLVTFHTARRSAATNMHLLNIPFDYIQKILGHQDISTTQKYVKTNIEQVAHNLQNHPFFNSK